MTFEIDPITGEPIIPPPPKALKFKKRKLSEEEMAKYFPEKRPECFAKKYNVTMLVDTKCDHKYLVHVFPKVEEGETPSDPLDVVYLYDEDKLDLQVTDLSLEEFNTYAKWNFLNDADKKYKPLREEFNKIRIESVMWYLDEDLFQDEECPWPNQFGPHERLMDEFYDFCEECARCRKLHDQITEECNSNYQKVCATLWAARKFASK